MRAFIEGSRALLFANTAAIDRSHHAPDEATRTAGEERASLLTPVSKAFATDLGVELTSIGVQIHGGMGFVEETGSAQHFRDARITPIYEGTNGIQAMDLVMRKLPLRNGGVVADYLAEVHETVAATAAAGLEDVSAGLATALADLEAATQHLASVENPNDALAGATPYCRLFGLVACGHYLGRQAVVASQSADDPWMQDKVTVATFYATQLLPQTRGLVPAVTASAQQLFDVDLATAGA